MKKKNIFARMAIYVGLTVLIGFLFVPVIKNLNFGLDLKGGFEILYKIEPLSGNELTSQALKSTVKSIRKRIDTLGVSEPEITVEGENIRIKLAGVTDEETAKQRLSTPAVLSFRDTEDNLLMDATVLTSGGASISTNERGQYVVALDIADNETFYRVTKDISNRGDKNYIVIWLDFDEAEDSFASDYDKCGALSDSRCISAATVSQAFSGNVILQGNFSKEEVENLVDLINSGSLPTKLTTLSSKTVDASFGNDMLVKAGIAGVISAALIILMLTIIYRVSGFFGGLCLIVYAFLVFLLFTLIDGVLTLPGIAAMILGIGMAVDSNVISFERIKDELRRGKELPAAIEAGDKSSLITILDANITTFIAAIILFIFGESSVKGFATILIITIIVTMFTMVFINRTILGRLVNTGYFNDKTNAFIGFKPLENRKRKNKKTNYQGADYLKYKKYYLTLPVIIIAVALGFYFNKGINFGIDFTGGSSITVMSNENIDEAKVEEILKDYEVVDKTFNNNEGYVKVTETLEDNDVNAIKAEFRKLGYDSDISVISTIVKKDLTKNALVSLLYAAVAMLIYITIRFTFNYSVSSIIALIHDVLMMASVFIIVRLQVNYIFIASLLTIIGYSINDTIVIFDRIREYYQREYKERLRNKEEVYTLVNMSISSTVFRTIFTTVTTLVPVIVLLCFGISSIFEFNIALLVGLIAGVFSSMLIAPTIWAFLTIKDLKHPEKHKEEYKDELEEMTIKGINA